MVVALIQNVGILHQPSNKKMKDKIKHSLKQIDYKLYGTLLVFGLLPTIYTTVRISFLGDLPEDWGFNIASQLSWVNIIYEVLQEAILLPIFFLLGKSLINKNEFENKIKSGLIVTFSIYAVMSILLFIFVKPLLSLMNQKEEIIVATSTYIRLETIASTINIIVQYLILILIIIKKEKYLLGILFIQMLGTILLDIFLISSLPISLNIGVNGVAISNIIINIVLSIILYKYFKKENFNIISKDKISFLWMRDWAKVGGYSGLESFIRNLAFMLMVLKMVNTVGEQGTFWIANSFIWGWLLLPILQLGKLIKRDCGEYNNQAISEKTIGYFILTGFIVLLWIISIPLWQSFMHDVMNIQDDTKVFNIVLISLGFYILFAFNNVIDSIFYGIGKTNYMLFQSIIVNTLLYGTLFI